MAVIGPFDFTGGYSPGYDFTNLPQKNYATVMKHCRLKAGVVVPRLGINILNSSPSNFPAKGLFVWHDVANSKYSLVATGNVALLNKIYQADISSFNPSTSSLTFTDYTGAVNGHDCGGFTTFDSLSNILVGASCDGVGAGPFKITAYNANAAALGGSPPQSTICKQVNNFMFLAGLSTSSTLYSRVYWSNVNDPETWTGTNVLDFNKTDGQQITALGSIGSDLYIFKPNSIGRLSTVTITVSGAVTLGPLVTVIRGVGCCGPQALDNLPNGNIVFVGSDGHFYEFDGSSLTDWSDQGYPNPNAFHMGQWPSDSVDSPGLQGAMPYVSGSQSAIIVIVRVVKGLREVLISYTNSVSTITSTPKTFAFNYETRKWNGILDYDTDSSFRIIYSMTTFEMSNILADLFSYALDSMSVVFSGSSISSTGYIHNSNNFSRPYPILGNSNSSPTVLTFKIGTSINLGGEAMKFLPRSLILEVHTKIPDGASALGAFNVYADYDVYEASTNVYTSSSASLPARIVIPLNKLKQDSLGTNVLPSNISILITGSGTGSGLSNYNNELIRIGRFWLSDEILR